MAEYRSESISLGDALGELTLRQMTAHAWSQATLAANSAACDATGLRVYGGCHVLCRFMGTYSSALNGRRVCELGCGTGVGSIVASRFCSEVLATDGDERAVAVCEENVQANGCTNVRVMQLRWGEDSAKQLLSEGATAGFDVVIASDVMYYNVDVPELMVTVKTLLEAGAGSDKLFVHAHLFRVDGQLQQVLRCCQQYGWVLYKVKLSHFIPAHELQRHVDWQRVKCLVCGPRSQAWEQYSFFDQLVEITPDAVDASDDEEDEDDNADNGDEDEDDDSAGEPDEEIQAEIARMRELLAAHGVVRDL